MTASWRCPPPRDGRQPEHTQHEPQGAAGGRQVPGRTRSSRRTVQTHTADAGPTHTAHTGPTHTAHTVRTHTAHTVQTHAAHTVLVVAVHPVVPGTTDQAVRTIGRLAAHILAHPVTHQTVRGARWGQRTVVAQAVALPSQERPPAVSNHFVLPLPSPGTGGTPTAFAR